MIALLALGAQADGMLNTYCWGKGDKSARDAFCGAGLVCARAGFDGRDYGGCVRAGVAGPPFDNHCCSLAEEWTTESDVTCERKLMDGVMGNAFVPTKKYALEYCSKKSTCYGLLSEKNHGGYFFCDNGSHYGDKKGLKSEKGSSVFVKPVVRQTEAPAPTPKPKAQVTYEWTSESDLTCERKLMDGVMGYAFRTNKKAALEYCSKKATCYGLLSEKNQGGYFFCDNGSHYGIKKGVKAEKGSTVLAKRDGGRKKSRQSRKARRHRRKREYLRYSSTAGGVSPGLMNIISWQG